LPSDGITSSLCRSLVELRDRPLPEAVERQARRTLLNALGVAIGASRHEAVEIAVSVAMASGSLPRAPLPGRSERLDPVSAALVTGLAAHVDDFDDTHLETVIHPGSVALASVLPAACLVGATGRAALTAFALCCETELRVGRAMSPWHFDAGWHITGTAGVIGAAAGAGLLLGLDEASLAHAIGIAASQTVGLRVAHGTMIKAAHPGKAAANGVLAALLASRGYTGPPGVLEAPRGYYAVLSPEARPELVCEGFGDSWTVLANTYKPYPGGVVSHPAIDAALALAERLPAGAVVEAIELRCHPLVLELTANPEPHDPLAARFSTPHAVAVALVDRTVGLAQYEPDRLTDPAVARLRALVRLAPDPALAREEAILELRMADGRRLREHVLHARGSLERPLTDVELMAKVQALVEPLLPDGIGGIEAAVRDLPTAPSVGRLVAAITPERPAEVLA
jgi:2-methylcitrate dehydratase PrpD